MTAADRSCEVSDIIDLIDGAIGDWQTSGDAMRWAPVVAWDEPTIRTPFHVVDRLIVQGWDGHAASAYDGMIVRSVARMFAACQDAAERFSACFSARLVALTKALTATTAMPAMPDSQARPLVHPPIKPSRRKRGWR